MRLGYVLNRATLGHYVCVIELNDSERLTFASVAHVSVGVTKPTAYREFVEELHVRLLHGRYRVTFMAGDGTGHFAVWLLWTLCVAIVGLIVVVIFAMNSRWWEFVGFALVYAGLLLIHIRYLRINEPRHYDPRQTPQNLLPKGQ